MTWKNLSQITLDRGRIGVLDSRMEVTIPGVTQDICGAWSILTARLEGNGYQMRNQHRSRRNRDADVRADLKERPPGREAAIGHAVPARSFKKLAALSANREAVKIAFPSLFSSFSHSATWLRDLPAALADPEVGAEVCGTDLGDELLGGELLFAEPLVEPTVEPVLCACPVDELVEEGRGIGLGRSATEQRHVMA